MKRTIIYVFGPKRLASEYQNGCETPSHKDLPM